MAILNPRRPVHQHLCLVLATLMLLGPATPLAAQQAAKQPGQRRPGQTQPAAAGAPAGAAGKVDARYIAPGACVIVAMRPAQFFRSPLAEWLPTEVIQTASTMETGLDPLQAELFVASYSPPTSYAAFATFQGKVAPKEGEWTAHTEAGELGGKLYLKSTSQMEPSFYMPDERSLLLAPDYLVNQVAGGKSPPPTPLMQQFVASAGDDDVFAMVDVGALRPMIKMGLSRTPIPPEAESLAKLPDLVKSVSLRVNLSRSAPSEAIVAANDRTDAQEIVAIFEDAKQLFAQQMNAESERLLASADPVEQATGRYMQRMSKTWNERIKLVVEEERIVLFRADLTESGMAASPLVIGVLVALLLPAIQAAREAARRSQSLNNLKQIMLALLNYEAVHRSYPAHANYDADGKPLLSWRVHILPFIEQGALYDQFHLDEPWDSEHNKALIAKMPAVYLDPSSQLRPEEGKSTYLGVVGEGYFFTGTEAGRTIRSITDGTSNSIGVVEVSDEAAAVWTKPEDWTPDAEDPLAGVGDRHTAGIFLAAFCDGSVQAIAKDIDLDGFRALLTVAGDDFVNRP